MTNLVQLSRTKLRYVPQLLRRLVLSGNPAASDGPGCNRWLNPRGTGGRAEHGDLPHEQQGEHSQWGVIPCHRRLRKRDYKNETGKIKKGN